MLTVPPRFSQGSGPLRRARFSQMEDGGAGSAETQGRPNCANQLFEKYYEWQERPLKITFSVNARVCRQPGGELARRGLGAAGKGHGPCKLGLAALTKTSGQDRDMPRPCSGGWVCGKEAGRGGRPVGSSGGRLTALQPRGDVPQLASQTGLPSLTASSQGSRA